MDRESSVALCHGVALKKKKWSVEDRESGVSLSLYSVEKMNCKVEKNTTRKEIGRELNREVFAVSLDKTGAVLGKDAHSSVLHTIGQRKVVVANVR